LKLDHLIVYKPDGAIDHKFSKFDELEQYAIDFLNLAQSFQRMTDKRLQENFITGIVEKAETEKLEEGKMNLLEA